MEESLDLLRYRTDAAQAYLIAWSGLLVWDWLVMLRAEVEHIWTKKKTPMRIVYLLNRYGTLALNSAAAFLILSHVATEVCHRLYWIEKLCLVYCTVITNVLLALRVFTIFDRSRIASIALTLLIAAQSALSVAAASHVHPLDIPTFLREYTGTYGCLVGDPEGKYAAFVLVFCCVPFGVTALLLAATVFRRWQIQRDVGVLGSGASSVQAPIVEKMVRDGGLYLVCITIVSSINAYLFIQPSPSIKSFNLCALVVVSSTLSCRLVLSLLANKPDSSTGVIVSQMSVSRFCDDSGDSRRDAHHRGDDDEEEDQPSSRRFSSLQPTPVVIPFSPRSDAPPLLWRSKSDSGWAVEPRHPESFADPPRSLRKEYGGSSVRRSRLLEPIPPPGTTTTRHGVRFV